MRVGNVFLPKALLPRTVGTCLVDCRQCRKLSMAGFCGQEAADQPFCDSLKATQAVATQSCLCQGIVLPGKGNVHLAELFSLFLCTLPDQILSWVVYLTVKLCVKHRRDSFGLADNRNSVPPTEWYFYTGAHSQLLCCNYVTAKNPCLFKACNP